MNVQESVVEMVVPIVFFTALVLIVYFTTKYSHLTKKAVIEKGGDIEFPKNNFKFPFLQIAMTAVGIGVGLLFSFILTSYLFPKIADEIITAAMILIFGGIGLVSSLVLKKKIDG